MLLKIFLLFLAFHFISSSPCPNGGIEYQSNCYYFNTVTSKGFAAAELACYQLGGHLSSIHDAFTNAVISQKSQNYKNNTEIWIGATKLLSQSQWSWTDNTTFDYIDWKQNEPKENSSNCATLSTMDGTWKVEDCYKQLPYVCKIMSSNLPKPCSDGPLVWHYFAPTQSCYKIFPSIMKGLQAETLCQNYSAHATSIHSFDEFKFLMDLLPANSGVDLWTGIFSSNGGQTWNTTDGTSADFLKYASIKNSRSGNDGVTLQYNSFTEEYYYWQASRIGYNAYTACKKPSYTN